MIESASLLSKAFEHFDRVNGSDPRLEMSSGSLEPKELLYAQRVSDRLSQFAPGASEALRLAARAQHIARWHIPRSSYPPGRPGYKAWRTELMRYHAQLAAEIMEEVGYDPGTIETVSQLLRKQGLKRNQEVQTLEDVVCIVFLEHYFDEFAKAHDDQKLVGILRKTWLKMSERGHAAAKELQLSERSTQLMAAAVAQLP
jgi:hypothetical protein